MTTTRVKNIVATGNLGPLGGKGSGVNIRSITVNKAAASAAFTIYDGQDATTGSVRGVIDATAARQIIYKGAWFKDGFFGVLSGGNADITVEYE